MVGERGYNARGTGVFRWTIEDRTKERNGAERPETTFWMETTMSNPYRSHLPPEILDYIVDLLQDEREALKECCLVSRSWVSRARKHLFANIKFHCAADIELWKKTFPNRSNSPACHTHTLLVRCPEVITAADAEEGGWIRTFPRVARLRVHGNPANDMEVSLIPFHVFSPVLKSLSIFFNTLPNSQVFDLISSLPLLEDLTLVIDGVDVGGASNLDAAPAVVQPPTSCAFTGTLELTLFKGMEPTTRRLLGLPNGLHFRSLTLSWIHEEDLQWINALVAGCSKTLECLHVACYLRGTFVLFLSLTCNQPHSAGDSHPTSIDFSKATTLRDAVFLPVSLSIEWVTLALQTITPKHRDLRQISIHVPYRRTFASVPANVRQIIGEPVFGQWLALDRVLVQVWESHSICPKIMYIAPGKEKKVMDACMGYLLPEITKRGIVDLVEWRGH